MNILSMVPGKKYLIGDSLGFDDVLCLENDGREVRVRLDETGREDILFEANEGFIHVIEKIA